MSTFHHPFKYHPLYRKRVAYFCMEYGIHQNLKIYSGGLGYLAGSHMRSAFDLKQNLIGIGIMWKYGYYDQIRRGDQSMDVLFLERNYSFLHDTGIKFDIKVDGATVWVKAWYLSPEVYGTAPIYLLSTDLEENDFLAKTICHRLYDSDVSAKVAQYILLGVGGSKLLELINYNPDYLHINEAHALPAIFSSYQKLGAKKTKEKAVFTTHTPVPAGNEAHNIHFLHKMGFFAGMSIDEVKKHTDIHDDQFNLTLAALRLCRKANAVSKMHGGVARKMWSDYKSICEIDHVTNAQHFNYWADSQLRIALDQDDGYTILERKKQLKKELFSIVADQTGKVFHEDIFTVVWARRFAAYKRAELPSWDLEAFDRMLINADYPIQIIWAGKPYPLDQGAINIFNHLVHITKKYNNCAVLVGYELNLSKALKQGADLWLNTPRITREASGTSGMTAAMNGAINFSTYDGWIPEFAEHGENSFIIPPVDTSISVEDQDKHDLEHFYDLMEHTVIPMYYGQRNNWLKITKQSMRDILPFFDSSRMARQYYEILYNNHLYD